MIPIQYSDGELTLKQSYNMSGLLLVPAESLTGNLFYLNTTNIRSARLKRLPRISDVHGFLWFLPENTIGNGVARLPCSLI